MGIFFVSLFILFNSLHNNASSIISRVLKNPQLVKPIEDSTKRKANIGAGTENRKSIN